MRTLGIGLLALGLSGAQGAAAVPVNVFGIDFEANKAASEILGTLQLTPPSGGRRGSAFALTPYQLTPASSFSTQFQFAISGGADGFSFVIQNDPAKVDAIGTSGNSLAIGDGFGAGSLNQEISPSVAVAFDTFGNPAGPNTVHIVQNGNIGVPLDVALSPVQLNNGAVHTAQVDYDATTKTLSVTVDGMAVVSTVIDLATEVGSEAFFGFTGATGAVVADHRITAWTPPALPTGAPVQANQFGPFPLAFNGDADVVNNGLSLTDNEGGRAGSAFSVDPLIFGPDTSFATDFEFVIGGGTNGADGFAFLIQNDPSGNAALGATGGSLGYLGPFENLVPEFITPNVAVEFRTFTSNQVALRFSTGDAGPQTTIASTAEGAFDLNGGMPIFVRIDYDGTTDLLEVFLRDDPTSPWGSAFLSGFVDIFALLGNSAFVGFSAATGGLINEHVIRDWTFQTGVPEPGTLLLLGLGLAGVACRRRMR